MEMPLPNRLKSELNAAKPSQNIAGGKMVAATQTNKAALILKLQSRAMAHQQFDAASLSAVTDLSILLKCERVSLGLIGKQKIEICAISGVNDIKQHQQALRLMAKAMQEAIDQGSSIAYPPFPKHKSKDAQEHANLYAINGDLAVVSVPILYDGINVAALMFENRQMMTQESLELAEDAALFVGPLLILHKQAQSSVLKHVKALTGSRISGPNLSSSKLPLFLGAIAIIALGASPSTYRVVAPARIEGNAQRVISAPIDGFIRSVSIRPGELVKNNQVILQLEDQDLKLEQEERASEVAKLDKLYRDALSNAEASAIVIAASKLEEARSQLSLATRQASRTTLRAPFDGVLIKGDLTQSIGMPVERGQELMTLATERTFRIVIDVEEQEISALKVGQQAHVLFATLDQPISFSVTRISPIASVTEEGNIFEVEGQVHESTEVLRHGLRGVAKIAIKPSFLAAVWSQRAKIWLRRTHWRLTG